jgi:hypothetical protein
MQWDTTEGSILMSIENPGIFVQVLKPQFPGDPKPGQNSSGLSGAAWANFPEAGLSFLHAIPAIGSKARSTESTGPQGQKPVANGDYQGVVRFYFGAGK